MPHYFVGLDLGQAADYTALAIIEAPDRAPSSFPVMAAQAPGPPPAPPPGYIDRGGRRLDRPLPRTPPPAPTPEPPVFKCTYLDRLPLGTNYLRVVEHVAGLLGRSPLAGATTLVVDATGVGAPVMDMFTAWGLKPIGITIHGGDAVKQEGRAFRTPKRDLVAVLQTLLQTGRLRFAKDLALAETLVGELRDYTVSLSPVGHDSYAARSGQHDDLVLAVAIAAWLANRRNPAPRAAPSPAYPTFARD